MKKNREKEKIIRKQKREKERHSISDKNTKV